MYKCIKSTGSYYYGKRISDQTYRELPAKDKTFFTKEEEEQSSYLSSSNDYGMNNSLLGGLDAGGSSDSGSDFDGFGGGDSGGGGASGDW